MAERPQESGRSRRCPCCGGYRDQYDACHFHETRDERDRYRDLCERAVEALRYEAHPVCDEWDAMAEESERV